MSPERWRQINDVFQAALEQPRPLIEEFLHDACKGDPALQTEVGAMLREHFRVGFMDESPWSPQSETTPAPGAPAFSTGELLSGRYRIVRFVSRGGMGEVYDAEDLELHERVAVKTLLPAIAADQGMIARFKQEIQLSRKVAHPNVCRMFDLGSHEGTYFLTMEFLAGETLATRLDREGPFEPTAALTILEHVAGALDAAHAAGVIHRDLKPSNVMLVPATSAGGACRAVVTDFGLARRFNSGETTQTVTSRLIGTLHYMAPELFSGGAAGVASDVYALGVVAREMVSPEELDSTWAHAIERSTDPDHKRRFSSAHEFLRELRGESAALPRVISRRKVIAATASLLLLIVAIFAWRAWGALRARPNQEALEHYMRGVDHIQSGAYFAATRALEQAVRLAPHYALAHVRLAEAWVELRVPENAKDAMLRIVPEDLFFVSEFDRLEMNAIRSAVLREFESAAARYEELSRRAGGRFDLDLGRAYERIKKSDAALACYRRATAADKPAAWLRLGVILSRRTKEEAAVAEEAFRKAEERYRSDGNVEGLTELAIQRGIWANRRNRFQEGADQLRSAVTTARLSGNVHQEITASLQLATNALLNGDSVTAEKLAREGLELAQSHQLETLAVTSFINLGLNYRMKVDLASAEKAYLEALNLARRANSQSAAALAELNLAMLHDQQRRYEESAREARAALDFFRANRSDNETASCLLMIARSHSNRGDSGPALEYFRAAREVAERTGDRNTIYISHSSMGNLLLGQDRFAEALEQFQLGLPFGDNQYAGYALVHYGAILWRLGRFDEAKQQFQSAATVAEKFTGVRIELDLQRAEMAVSQRHAEEAIALLQQLKSSLSSSDDMTASEFNRIWGLALLLAGKPAEALRMCENSLVLASKLDRASVVAARLATLEARLKARQLRAALKVYTESRWRALALLTAAGQKPPEDPRKALDELARLWGDATYRGYMSRPDILQLSWPLLHSKSAK